MLSCGKLPLAQVPGRDWPKAFGTAKTNFPTTQGVGGTTSLEHPGTMGPVLAEVPNAPRSGRAANFGDPRSPSSVLCAPYSSLRSGVLHVRPMRGPCADHLPATRNDRAAHLTTCVPTSPNVCDFLPDVGQTLVKRAHTFGPMWERVDQVRQVRQSWARV